jgi:hypothetical protein
LKHVERMKSIAFQHLSISGSRLNRMHTDAWHWVPMADMFCMEF